MTDATVTLADGSIVTLPSESTVELAVSVTGKLVAGSSVTPANENPTRLDTEATVTLTAGSKVKVAAGSTVTLSGRTPVKLEPESQVTLATGSEVTLSTGEAKPSNRSQNLVLVVAATYGVGISGVLAVNKPWVDHPTKGWPLSLVVLGVAVFMIYGAFSYVMSVSEGPFVYHFGQDVEAFRVHSLARVLSDLVLAALYVRVLLVATDDSRLNPRDLFFAMAWVFGWVVVVRLVRYGPRRPERWRNLPSVLTAFWFGLSLWFALSWDSWFRHGGAGSLASAVGGLVVFSIVSTEGFAKLARGKVLDTDIEDAQQIRKEEKAAKAQSAVSNRLR
jgi:hypothetical protein